MDLLNNGWHGCNGFSIRHTLIERNIALRWSDGTETASVYSSGRRPSVFPIPPNSPQAVGPLITQALLLRRRCRTPTSLRLCVQKKMRASYTLLGVPPPILSMLTLSAEFSYPEGVERLIGQGWREAATLSNGSIGIIELCRSSTAL